MLVKTVDTVLTINSDGQVVESIPVREAVAGETDINGSPIDLIIAEESDVGVPIRFVVGKSAQNSLGQWVDTIPIAGGRPWRSFDGLAFRVGGQTLRVTSKALVVENPND